MTAPIIDDEPNEVKPKHTPGPWHYIGSAAVETGGGKSRFEFLLTRRGEGAPPAEWVANARLISAAPDLLASLKEMIAIYDGVRDALMGDVVPAKLKRADAAVRKAEGRHV